MKIILPTLKERNRYIVYEVKGNKNFIEIKKELRKSMLHFLGEFEYAR